MTQNTEFSLLAYVKQYQNDDLCAKWDNNIPLSELQSPDYDWYDSTQDVQSIKDMFSGIDLTDITAFICMYGDGDYRELYVTESSRPYSLRAIYHPLSYYIEQ